MRTREPRTIALTAFALFVAAVVAFAIMRILDTDEAAARDIAITAPTTDAGVTVDGEVRVTIPEGATPDEIVDALAGAGVAADGETLRALMLFTDAGSELLAGEYRFGVGTPPAEILRRLRGGPDRIERITFRPGLRVEEIGEILEREDIFTFEQWDSAIATADTRAFMGDDTDFLGYLMPGEYEIEPETTAVSLLEAMLDRFGEEVTPDLVAAAEEQGWSLREVLTLASIVEREAVHVEEKPLVAAVFRNRIDQGIPLQADPTVQFALTIQDSGIESVEEYTWWKQELTIDDLALDSVFNTYLYPGLVPGPISNPDIDSIRAVIDPADSPDLYFVAAPACDGTHIFAATLEEHSANVELFRNSACGQSLP